MKVELKPVQCCIAVAMAAGGMAAAPAGQEPQPPAPVEIKVDASKTLGPVKPVNGVGQPPIIAQTDHRLFKYLKEAGIPFSRLHDVCWPYGGYVFVDIPNIFRDFDADENDPANYDFAFTDHLLKDLVKHNVKPFYRLGVTIENNSGIRAYNVFPPKDFAKWARICEHIVMHYNEGWANGFKFGIEYWEIWNEPDLGGNMWRGSFAEYIDLYVTSSKWLKGRFPNIKVGGFASCGFHAAIGYKDNPSIYRLKCINEFLAAVKKEEAPLDFFSFHSYSGLNELIKQIEAGRKILDEAGFPGIEMCLNEWQTLASGSLMGTAQQAATLGATLLAFQASTLDSAAIYDASCWLGVYSPLFDGATEGPRKGYYAFRSFHELRKLKDAVEATSSDPGVYVGAAAKDGKVAVMIANTTDKSLPYRLDIGGPLPSNCRVTDATRDFKNAKLPAELPPYSVVVVVK